MKFGQEIGYSAVVAMAMLAHEIWEDANGLPSLCLAGPHGDGCRGILDQPARLIHTYAAGSYFEAMTIYYVHQGWGTYTSDFAIDHEPYPDDWAPNQPMRSAPPGTTS